MMSKIDTHRFRSHFIIPDRLQCPAVAGIDQQDDQQPTLFKGQAKNPEYRVCFGTLQLASDILEKMNLPVKEEYDALGTLLNFVETNK